MKEKKCSKCSETKPVTDFYICTVNRVVYVGKVRQVKKVKRIRCSCKKCDNAMSKAYKSKSKKHISKYNKQYKSVHKDEISVYNHEYNLNNREAIQKRQTSTRRIRKQNDPNFDLATKLRSKLCSFIINRTGESGMSQLIGCSFDAFEFWLTFLFEDEMSMKNYGKYWTIDHVNPCNFDLTEEENQYECFHWSNLRPMQKLLNSKKTGKVIEEEIEQHQKLVKQFLKILPKSEQNNYTLLV